MLSTASMKIMVRSSNSRVYFGRTYSLCRIVVTGSPKWVTELSSEAWKRSDIHQGKLVDVAANGYFTKNILCPMDTLMLGRDDGTVSHAVLIELARAFDMLFFKPKHYLVFRSLNSLMKRFLSNRFFQVRTEVSLLETEPIHSKLPQGSIFGPLSFLMCINNLFDSIPIKLMVFKLILYYFCFVFIWRGSVRRAIRPFGLKSLECETTPSLARVTVWIG